MPDEVAELKSFFAHYFGGIYHRVAQDHVFLFGGGLAFSMFTCIVPLVLLLFFGIGSLLDTASLEGQIDLAIDTFIPYQNSAQFVKEILFSRVEELVAHRNIYGLVGVTVLLFTASGLFSSMRTILNTCFRVEDQQSEVLGKLKDFGMIFLVICCFLASVTFFPFIGALGESVMGVVLPSWVETFQGFSAALVSLIIIFVVFFILYYLVPYGDIDRKVAAFGALWGAILWVLVKQVFGWYLGSFANIERIYGAYMLVVVVGLWIYLASIVFILGAELAQLYRERNIDPQAEVQDQD